VEAEFTGRTVVVTAGGGNVGRRIVTLEADISTADGADRVIAAAGDRVDVLCNNAALIEVVPVDEIEESVWRGVLDVNLTGPLLLCSRGRAVTTFVRGAGGWLMASRRAEVESPTTPRGSA
jgi:NAD(P)-dependent dehydrogenase (short-subunit alcohol dehydrogenase family)